MENSAIGGASTTDEIASSIASYTSKSLSPYISLGPERVKLLDDVDDSELCRLPSFDFYVNKLSEPEADGDDSDGEEFELRSFDTGVSVEELDYKNVALLQTYLSELGHVLPRLRTGLNNKQHHKLVKEVKKCRQLGLLAFSLY
ncbi:MAG: 30S ribosomal protein S18 [Candidatus Hodgkinia cicadicola]|nr:MAG: 30S ribosomal protein S18 [Candidatus Hodgkinia cicadicola]